MVRSLNPELPRMAVRALLFDLDDTLMETHHSHQEAMRISCERAAAAHPDWTVDRLREAFVTTYRALEDRLESGEISFPSQVPFRIRTWEDTLSGCGLSPDLGEEL